MKWTHFLVFMLSALVLAGGILFVFDEGQANVTTSAETEEQVLHVQANLEVFSPEKVRAQREFHEFWFDPNTLDTRYTIQSSSGANDLIIVRQGRIVRTYHVNDRRLIIEIAATDEAEMLNVVDRFFGYQLALQRGDLQPLEESVVANQQALRVERRDSDGFVIVSWLDKHQLFPLEETYLQQGPDGTRNEVQTLKWVYPIIEWVSKDKLPAEIFSFATPPDVAEVTYHYLSISEAATFKEFDVYYLGNSFNGLPVFGITVVKSFTNAGEEALVRFNVLYAQPFTLEREGRVIQVSLVQEVTTLPQPREIAPGVAAVGESVEVNGREATLYEYPGGADLELQIGNTLITIHGPDRQIVVQAAGLLKKLN